MKTQIDQTLKELIPKETGALFESAQYSLEGGKRLRPLLMLAVVETFGKSIESALHPACAIEMIHAYSLIHDDLPCMDNDYFRRGKPSLHKAYSEWQAILTGDFLLTYAFEVVSKSPFLSDEEKNAITKTLALRAGGKGMIGGQVLDIKEKTTTQELLTEVYIKKTGALFTAALECGGIIGGQNDLTCLQAIGESLGLAYQIIDDLLDEDGITKLLGNKKAQETAEGLFEKANQLIKTLPNGAPKLETIAKEMIFRSV